MRLWAVLALALLLAASAPAAPPSRFGVVVDLDPAHPEAVAPTFRAIKEAGLGWVRVRPDWRALQGTDGPPSWEWTDTVVRSARENGLEVLFTLGYTPRWASRYADSGEADVWSRNPPRTHAAWEEYVRRLSTRYSNEVGHWQVWEQPSLHHFRGSWKDLRDLLASSTKATRGRAVRRQVLPESGGLNLSAIDQMYAWGADTWFDVLGLYPNFDRPEALERPLDTLRTRIVDKKGPRKDLWIAGMGWNVTAPPPPLQSAVVDEADQARYLVRGTALALSHGVERVFWQAWQDRTDGPYQEQVRSGLRRPDGSARPALAAYRALVARLEGLAPAGSAKWGPHAWGPVFASGDRAVLVAWTDRESIRIPLPSGLTVEDHLGSRREGGDRLEAGPSPVYVSGPRALVERLAATPPDRSLAADPDYSGQEEVRVDLGSPPREAGVGVARFRQVESRSVQVAEKDGSACWGTDLAKKQSAILFDVDDSFLYFNDGRYRVEVTVEHAAAMDGKAGFNLGYDSTKGYAASPWHWIEPGPGWKEHTFVLRDADFSDPWSDFRINALASPRDVFVRSVRVRRIPLK